MELMYEIWLESITPFTVRRIREKSHVFVWIFCRRPFLRHDYSSQFWGDFNA